MSIGVVITKPELKKIEAILKMYNMKLEDLKCSICGQDLSDLKHLRAIFPYKSALICCDKFDCLTACRDKLLAKSEV